jgi:hypothetical protein
VKRSGICDHRQIDGRDRSAEGGIRHVAKTATLIPEGRHIQIKIHQLAEYFYCLISAALQWWGLPVRVGVGNLADSVRASLKMNWTSRWTLAISPSKSDGRMPAGYGLYGGTGLGTVTSSANVAWVTLTIPSIASKTAITNIDLCRRIGIGAPSLGCGLGPCQFKKYGGKCAETDQAATDLPGTRTLPSNTPDSISRRGGPSWAVDDNASATRGLQTNCVEQRQDVRVTDVTRFSPAETAL